MTAQEIRARLARLAGGVAPKAAHYIEDFDPPDGEATDFCEPCAEERAGHRRVCRESNHDSDMLRWCADCGALLDFRIGPEEAAVEVARFEAEPPTEPRHWAELLHAMAEVPPEDWRGPGDPQVPPIPLWARVQALLAAHGATGGGG